MFLLEVEKLTIHPLIEKLVPTISENSFDEFVKSVIKWGIKDPIEILPDPIDEKFYIVDGRHRFHAALKLKIKKVPVKTIPLRNDELEEYILFRALRRRHLTSEQKACLAVEWILRKQSQDSAIIEASRKFSVRKNTICLLLEIKNKNEKLFDYFKEGYLTLADLKGYNEISSFNMQEIQDDFIKKINLDDISHGLNERFEEIQEKEIVYQDTVEKNIQLEQSQKKTQKKLKNYKKEINNLKKLLSIMYIFLKQTINKSHEQTTLDINPADYNLLINSLQNVINIDIDNININLNSINTTYKDYDEEKRKILLRTEHILTYCEAFFKSNEIKELYYYINQDLVILTKDVVKKIDMIARDIAVFHQNLKRFLIKDVLSSRQSDNLITAEEKSKRRYLTISPVLDKQHE